jgi:hypothetical protein
MYMGRRNCELGSRNYELNFIKLCALTLYTIFAGKHNFCITTTWKLPNITLEFVIYTLPSKYFVQSLFG